MFFLRGSQSCGPPLGTSKINKTQVYGTIPNVKAKGSAAVACLLRAMRMRREEAGDGTAAAAAADGGGMLSSSPGIDTLVLLDRCATDVDLVRGLACPMF